MRISVIIAAYNAEKYVGRAVRSLIDQSFPKKKYEIIVMDDGSDDNTLEVLKSYGNLIRLIPIKKNSGLPRALNIGIRNALSPFIVRVDADDYVHKDFLHIENLFLSLNNYMDAVACDYYLVDEKENVIERKDALTHPIACGIMFRKDFLVDIGLYDETFLMAEDEELRFRYLEKYNIHRIELPLYRYRKHSSNITNNSELWGYYKDLVYEKHDKKNM